MGVGMILTHPAFSSMGYETLYESLQRTDFIVVGTITKKKIESDKTYNYLRACLKIQKNVVFVVTTSVVDAREICN